MACRNIILNVLGNENSLSKYIINKIAFNFPSSDTYSIKISNELYSHNTKINKPLFTQFGICKKEVELISQKFPFFPSLYPFLTIKSYLLYKPQTQSHICVINIKNKASLSNPKRHTIIYSHGNSSDLEDNLPFLTSLSNVLKCDVISYDYSGFGCSSGNPSEDNIKSDLDRVIDFSLNELKYKIDNLILFGYSIGSICTINSAVNSEWANIAGVVLMSPLVYGLNKYFNDEKEKKENKIDVIKDNIEQTNYFKISQIDKPILLIHGKEDEIVPYNHAIQLSKRIQQLYQWFPKDGNHNNIPYEKRYKFYTKFKTFIDHIKTTKILQEAQYANMNSNDKVIKVETIKNYINKEDNDKANESIQMFINGDDDITETTTNITSQRVSQGNVFSYYGSVKPNFNGFFNGNQYNDDDDY